MFSFLRRESINLHKGCLRKKMYLNSTFKGCIFVLKHFDQSQELQTMAKKCLKLCIEKCNQIGQLTDAKYTFSLDLQNGARVYLTLHGIRNGILAQRKCLPNKPRMVSDKIAPPAPFIFPSPEGWPK